MRIPPKAPPEEPLVLSVSTNPASPIVDMKRGHVISEDKLRSHLADFKSIISKGPMRRTAVHILGSKGVGKTSLATALKEALSFTFEYITGKSTLSDFVTIRDGEPVATTREEVVVLVVYDICSPSSLTAALGEFDRGVKLGSASNTNILVGNRIDLEYWRRVSVEEGAKVAIDSNPRLQYMEVSALTGMHVDLLADIVLRRVLLNLNLASTITLLGEILTLKQHLNLLASTFDIDRDSGAISSSDSSIDLDLQSIGMLGGGTAPYVQRGGGGVVRIQRKEEEDDDDIGRWSDEYEDYMDQAVVERRSVPLSPPPPPPPPRQTTTTTSPPPSASVNSSVTLPPRSPRPPPPSSSLVPMNIAPPLPPISMGAVLKPTAVEEQLGAESEAQKEKEAEQLPRARRQKRKSAKREDRAVLIEEADLESAETIMVKEDSARLYTKTDMILDLLVDDSAQSRLDDIETNAEEERRVPAKDEKELRRDDRVENIELGADEIEETAKPFKKASQKSTALSPLTVLCLPFMACASCMTYVGDSIAKLYKEWSAKSLLFDNVLADTENAFQTLAKFLNFLLGSPCSEGLNLCLRILYGFWVDTISWAISSVVVLVSTVVLILPSFFTLLIVRTTTVEKESKAFGVRQEVIRKEKKEESFVRWVRIILRSLPMTFYILVLPYILVYHVFPTQGEEDRIATIVCYIIGVILLQILGSVRAYYSWKSRDEVVPEPPALYYDPSLKEPDDGLVGKLKTLLKKEEPVKLLPTPRPKPPAAFDYTNPSNLMELASLTLEFFQMATFALQNNPYESTINEPTAAPTMAPSVSEESSTASTSFWGPNVFEVLYIDLPSAQDMQFIIMWTAVGVVWALILIFVGQFLMELKLYGRLMARIEDSDKAKDSFFFSFTGSIVYGHGKPRNISDSMRLIVGMLSDGLFLIISFQLLQAFSCDYTGSGSPTLRADASIVCWEGRHAVVGTAALISYAFYVPLSIMISPMLLEAPPKPTKPGEPPQQNTGVSYMKLYLMFINTVKSIMLVVGVMGPETVATVVISSTASSCVLGIMTILWYQSYVPTAKHYSSTPEPCNIAFINYWKAASYVAAVSSALIVITAYELTEDVFPVSGLTTALIVSWVIIIVIFVGMYYRYHSKYDDRMDLVSDLITYPFDIRDCKEQAAKHPREDRPVWRGLMGFPSRLAHIPGFTVSPWADKRATIEQQYGVIPGGASGDIAITDILVAVTADEDTNQSVGICD